MHEIIKFKEKKNETEKKFIKYRTSKQKNRDMNDEQEQKKVYIFVLKSQWKKKMMKRKPCKKNIRNIYLKSLDEKKITSSLHIFTMIWYDMMDQNTLKPKLILWNTALGLLLLKQLLSSHQSKNPTKQQKLK